ncbi:MAG: hypothetical protein R3F17_09580 [Planctomycetota bacterium]
MNPGGTIPVPGLVRVHADGVVVGQAFGGDELQVLLPIDGETGAQQQSVSIDSVPPAGENAPVADEQNVKSLALLGQEGSGSPAKACIMGGSMASSWDTAQGRAAWAAVPGGSIPVARR